jgi:5-methylcytosine-specific restriction endonuclease McrA
MNKSKSLRAAWNSQIRTLHDAYNRDPAEGRHEENSYRRGYVDGVAAAIDLLQRGATIRQINEWRWKELQQWRKVSLVQSPEPPMIEPWSQIRKRIFKRDGHVCTYCGARGATHIDHVVPVSTGGSYEDDNLVVACRACNLSKGTKSLEEWQRE